MKEYHELATLILQNCGGEKNIIKVYHCATRLRLILADTTKINEQILNAHKNILGIINRDPEIHLIIGFEVSILFKQIQDLLQF